MIFRVKTSVLSVLFLGVLLGAAAQDTYAQRDAGILVFPRHPVYELLERLELAGAVPAGMLEVRPLTAGQVAGILDSVRTADLLPVDRNLLDVFREEFAPRERGRIFSRNGSRVEYVADGAELSAGPSVRVTATAYPDGDVNLLREQGVEGFGSIGSHFSFYGSMYEVLEQGDRSMPPSAYSPERGATGWNRINADSPYSWDASEGYLALTWNRVGVWMGKFPRSWGPGRRGQVFLSDKPPSSPQLMVTITPWNWLRYRYTHVQLESGIVDSATIRHPYPTQEFSRTYGKWLTAQRIDVMPFRWLRIGLNQSIIYGAAGFDFGYLMPLVDLRHIQHAKGDRDNTQLGADVSVYWPRYVAWYGAVFIDELSLSKVFDSEKNRNWIAYQFGVRVAHGMGYLPGSMIRVEYTRINPRVYAHRYPWSTFTNAGLGLWGADMQYPLGFWLGENSDDLYAEASYDITGRLRVTMFGERTRKGDPPPVEEAYLLSTYTATPFLWGDVETTWRGCGAVTWRTWRQLTLEGAVGYEKVSAPDGSEGEWNFRLSAAWNKW